LLNKLESNFETRKVNIFVHEREPNQQLGSYETKKGRTYQLIPSRIDNVIKGMTDRWWEEDLQRRIAGDLN